MARVTSSFLRARIAENTFRLAAWQLPTSIWIRLYTTTPTGVDGTGGVEASGNAYTAKQVNVNNTVWQLVGTTITNINSINVGTPTGGNWGNIAGAAAWSLASGGDFYFAADLEGGPAATVVNVPVIIGPGELVFEFLSAA